MRLVVASDKFKGSLPAAEVGAALARGVRRVLPDADVRTVPVADGGDGTLAAAAAAGFALVPVTVSGPTGEPVETAYARRGDTAIVELADASGLARLPDGPAPLTADTAGTGEAVAAALAAGCREVVLGVGGSSSTDGGAGLAVALGARVLDATGSPVAPGGLALAGVASLDLTALAARLDGARITVASDVDNPLTGPSGAAAVYGPQKGATPDDVADLDRRLARYADALESAGGRRVRDNAGAGAAGGVGFALLAIADRFRSFALRPGIELVFEATDFARRLAIADLVITGEGRIDAQTSFGKTALGVARRAAAAGVPCVAVGGGVEVEGIDALAASGAIAMPVTERPLTVEAAMAAGPGPVARTGERIARLVSIGLPRAGA